MASELERAALMLQNDGYIIGQVHEDPEQGIVAFFDPASLRPGWNGNRAFGLLRLTTVEILRLKHDPNAKAEIYHKVQQAEERLSEDL